MVFRQSTKVMLDVLFLAEQAADLTAWPKVGHLIGMYSQRSVAFKARIACPGRAMGAQTSNRVCRVSQLTVLHA